MPISNLLLKNKELLKYLQNSLGLDTSAISVANEYDNKLILLKNSKLQEDLKIDCPELPYSIKNGNYLVDYMYIRKRGKQPLKSEDSEHIIPEFYRSILSPKQNDFESPAFSKIRENNISYFTSGEILFVLYSWRLYIRLAQSKGLDCLIDLNNINTDEIYIPQNNIDNFWTIDTFTNTKLYEEIELADIFNISDQPNIDYKIKTTLLKNISEAKNIDSDGLVNDKYNFYNEWVWLGLLSKKQTVTSSFINMIMFMKSLKELQSDKKVIKKLDDIKSAYFQSQIKDITYYKDKFNIQQLIAQIIQTIIGENKQRKIVDLLFKIHTKARYPFIQYYYQIALDTKHTPIESLFLPLWKSNAHKIEISLYENASFVNTNIITIGLFTLTPIDYYNEDYRIIKNNKDRFDIDSELSNEFLERIEKIKIIFKILTEQLVDQVFYDGLIKKQIKFLTLDQIKSNIAHELTKVSSNIFKYSIANITDLFEIDGENKLNERNKIGEINITSNLKIDDWKIVADPIRFYNAKNYFNIWLDAKNMPEIMDIHENDNIIEVIEKVYEMSKKSYLFRAFENYPPPKGLAKIEFMKNYLDSIYAELPEIKFKNKMEKKLFWRKIEEPNKGSIYERERKYKEQRSIRNRYLQMLICIFNNILKHKDINEFDKFYVELSCEKNDIRMKTKNKIIISDSNILKAINTKIDDKYKNGDGSKATITRNIKVIPRGILEKFEAMNNGFFITNIRMDYDKLFYEKL